MTMIKVTYRKPSRADDPARKITAVTLNQNHVPRVGDWVGVNVRCSKKEYFVLEGWVKSVDWRVLSKETTATVTVSQP